MRNLLAFVTVFGLTGCEEYYSVDEACFEALPGASSLPPTSRDAMARVNCYRHLTGVLKVAANDQVQIAADGVTNYVALNPDADLLANSAGAKNWLKQINTNPGFTGVEVYERLTGLGAGQAAYSFFDPINTNIWEFIHVEIAESPEDLPSGAAAVDELMRYPEFRQVALQPSWIDGAYSERDLPPPWSSATGDTPVEEGGPTLTGGSLYARVYYMIVIYTAPHLEHVDRPVTLPKRDQIAVPLYSWSANRNLVLPDGTYAPTQVSYPITLLMGALDPANYSEVDTNQYQAQFTNAAIASETGEFLEVEPVIPGDLAEEVWPEGRFLRTTLALYADRPFEPATTYTLYAEYTSPEGTFSLDYSFRTTNEDPGVDPEIGRQPTTGGATGTAPTARRSSRGVTRSAPPATDQP